MLILKIDLKYCVIVTATLATDYRQSKIIMSCSLLVWARLVAAIIKFPGREINHGLMCTWLKTYKCPWWFN